MKKRAIRLAIVALFVAIVAVAFGVTMGGPTAEAKGLPLLMVGLVAITFSAPLVGALILFSSSRSLRKAWRYENSAKRRLFGLYITIDLLGAAITWTVFVALLRQ